MYRKPVLVLEDIHDKIKRLAMNNKKSIQDQAEELIMKGIEVITKWIKEQKFWTDWKKLKKKKF